MGEKRNRVAFKAEREAGEFRAEVLFVELAERGERAFPDFVFRPDSESREIDGISVFAANARMNEDELSFSFHFVFWIWFVSFVILKQNLYWQTCQRVSVSAFILAYHVPSVKH